MSVKTYPVISCNDLHGLDEAFPSSLCRFHFESREFGDPGDTCYVFVHEGVTRIESVRFAHPLFLEQGMFASIPFGFRVTGGIGIVVQRHGFVGVFSMGGPIEKVGRLRYIDGCTDSLLIGPPKLGDPCLNHLHFPPGIDQTAHTHPSCRVGIIHRGKGECETPERRISLVAGTIFAMTPESVHKFRTFDESMDVIAYHPDSDTGPTDDDHPMLNRTIVDGVPAHLIQEIRTKI
jgi:hypothetical protein